MQTVDAAIYTIKSIKDRSDIDLMEASDDKKTGPRCATENTTN